MNQRPDTLAHAPLGRESSYPERYDASLLYPIARAANRAPLGLEAPSIPFHGEDEWHAFEMSWLNARGKPMVAVARFHLPASSPHLIESKSWKLYLNSFNQARFDHNDAVIATLMRDLSAAAGAAVRVSLLGLDDPALATRPMPGLCLDDMDIEVSEYTPMAEHLKLCQPPGSPSAVIEEILHSHLLKSNCPVTGQPDWGSVLIHYRGPAIDHESLLRYLIGYRQHQDFHEHCVEHIFTDIYRRLAPEALLVQARYVRRGGLDISPWRATPGMVPPMPLRLSRQ